MAHDRIMFWQIDYIWIFYTLSALAMGIFLVGIAAHVQVWKKNGSLSGISFSGGALKKMLLDVFVERRLIRGDNAAGFMHLLIFWGFLTLFIGTSVLAIHHYLFSFLEGKLYLIFSLLMEIAGILLLAGIAWALIRRYLQRVPRLERRIEDGLVPLWLLLIVLSGFLVEAMRLAVQQPDIGSWSFVGWSLIPLFSPESATTLYPTFWWGHILLCLSFIAMIPYTKLFHVIGAPASIYVQDALPLVPVDAETDLSEDSTEDSDEDSNGEFGLKDAIFFDGCMRCGRCVAVCPSTAAGEPFAPREFVQAARHALWQGSSRFGDIRFSNQDQTSEAYKNFWHCTTCRACLEVCPVYGGTFEIVNKKRMTAVEEGENVPTLMSQTLEKLFKYSNPWESSKKKRGAWAKDLEVTDLTKKGAESDLCYFVGCTTSFDDNAQVIARSFTEVLKTAGVNFGILGKKEPCCGDIARRVGETGLFIEQKEGCEELFDKYGITDVVTSSPHCFHTFKNEYTDAAFQARHYTLVLHELLAQGKIQFKNRIDATVTYHDPCYLGRYNRIFDEPRALIRAIPGINLVEMDHHHENSLCCGGGGGRMWQEIQGDVKISELRIREAEITGAQILVTTCPLCLIMMEDARKAAGLKEPFRVMDLNQLLLKAMTDD